jgi:cysteinyl-tRNA synthetase
MHNEMLQVEGKKMSKSLGNFFTVRDLLDQGVPGFLIRMVFLMTHYSKPMNWTEAKWRQAQTELYKWSFWIKDFGSTKIGPSAGLLNALADDLNTPQALTHLRELFSNGSYEQLAADLKFLGIWDGANPSQISLLFAHNTFDDRAATDLIDELLRAMETARNNKDYGASDKIRDGLRSAGVSVKSGKEGTTYELMPDFDPSKLEDLL